MQETLFIADLHLDRQRPRIIGLFIDFLHREAGRAEALYILGDLFEYWIGDDDPVPPLQPVIAALRALSDHGVPVYFIHGNRDFLIGEGFARQSGCTLLPETEVIEVYGEPTLITHGDTLCTDDKPYQMLRAQLRDEDWQARFLAQSLEDRQAQAAQLRERSRMEVGGKAEAIMDVNPRAVTETMRARGVRRLIHGHTHRPAIHEFELDGERARRIVLGDWHEQSSVLRCTPQGCEFA